MRTGTVAWRGLKGRPRCAPVGGLSFYSGRIGLCGRKHHMEVTATGAQAPWGANPLGLSPPTEPRREDDTIRFVSCLLSLRPLATYGPRGEFSTATISLSTPFHRLPYAGILPARHLCPERQVARSPAARGHSAASFLRTSSPAPSTRFGSLAGRVLTPAPRGRI